MKILVFTWKDVKHPWAGGSEVNIAEQARRWAADGHEVTVFTSRFKGMRRRDKYDGVEVFRAGGRFTIYLLAPLFYLLFLRRRAEVVLDIINGIPFFTPVYCRKPIVGLVHHVHKEMFTMELGALVGTVGKAIEKYIVPLLYASRPFICVSDSTADGMRNELYHGDRLDTRVIRNGISQDHFGEADPARFEEPTVLYLGRLKRYKQLPVLIGAMRRVRDEVPGARLLVVGWGDARPAAEAAARELGVTDCVTFKGFVSDEEKMDLYHRSWVLATASLIEGWGLTVIEANACGMPTVAFDVPGLNESIVDGETGLLVDDEDGFAEALIELLKNDPRRKALADGARRWSTNFSWDSTAARSLEVLEEARLDRTSQARPGNV